MRVLFGLVLGIAIGGAAIWYYRDHQPKPESHLQQAADQLAHAAQSAGTTIEDKLHSLHLTSDDIKKDLAHTGEVIREKAQETGQAISDATADARVTAKIKAKLLRDPDLSAWNISVNTTDGVVTLSGSVSSVKDIGKAILLAMDTDGVHKVVSTLQVKSK